MRKRSYGLLYSVAMAGLFGFGAEAHAEFVLERNTALGQNGRVAERVLEVLITGTNAAIRTPETIIAGVASCGGGDDGGRCSLTGTVRLVQLGDRLDGESQLRMVCESQGEAQSWDIALTITDGSVADDGTVAFAAGNCTFDGRFSDADRMTLNGEVLCGGTQTLMGSFQAIR